MNVQINGDAAWSLIANTTYAEAQIYLDNRAAKGVNAVYISMIEHQYTNNSPLSDNVASDPPFDSVVPTTSSLDFTDPNTAYWNHVDAVINYARLKGITVFAFPAYVGYHHNGSGWAVELGDNGTTRCTTYGEWLGTRYKEFSNLVWVMGGDADGVYLTSDVDAEINALANGIKANDLNHLMSAHSYRGRSALDDYDEAWLDFNTVYELPLDIPVGTRTEYELGSPKPIIFIEGHYGNGNSLTDLDIMRQMYHPILHGAIGHFTGSAETWSFSATNADSFADIPGDWDTTLDDYGAQYLIYVQRLQASRDLPSLTPDHSGTFVTAGKGSEGLTYSPVLASSSMLVAFCNQGADLTVDMSQFSGSVNGRWYDPTTGSNQTESGSPFTNSGSKVFNSPDANDWVLMIDLVSLSLSMP